MTKKDLTNTLYDTAMRVLAARDALLLARANRKAARLAFNVAVSGMYVCMDDGGCMPKFERTVEKPEYDEYGRVIHEGGIFWDLSHQYRKICSEAERELCAEDCKSHPDFIAMHNARNALKEPIRLHGIALRRLLSIGVKRSGVA